MQVLAALGVGTVVVLVPRLAFVLVSVMAEMLRLASRFMLAIAAQCSPTELQRHHHQQENRQPTAHKNLKAQVKVE